MKLVVDLHDEVYNNMVVKNEYTDIDVIAVHNALMGAVLIDDCREREFEKIVVEYPSEELCAYPEYKGKPYFSIQYEENGEHFIGFGTYNHDVLSRYLTEYFIMPEITRNKDIVIDRMKGGEQILETIDKYATYIFGNGLSEENQIALWDDMRDKVLSLKEGEQK